MTLTLTMLRCPDAVPPQTRSVAGGEFSIGRGPDNDWVLPDPERGLSKCHCVIAFRSGSWQIADLSTNGTFLNREGDPIGRGLTRDLRDGDRMNFGAYEIEIRISEAPAVSPRVEQRTINPFAEDVFATPAARQEAKIGSQGSNIGLGTAGDPFAVNLAPPAINLPPDYDPLAPDDDPVEERIAGPIQSDHSPHLEDAFTPPAAYSVLPDDWDREISPQARSAPPAEVVFPAAEPAPPEQATAAPVPIASPVPMAVPVQQATPPAHAAPQPTPPAVSESPVADLLTAFLQGGDIRDVRPADPVAAMEALGAAFRATVSGLRQAMIARAAIKSEFRIEQTLIRSRGNNPLKFSADDDDALKALLDAGRRADMSAVDAVTDALRDIRLHEIATVAAMQSAVRALLEEFEPGKLRHAAERGGALALVPGQRKAHAWDEFEALHGKISRALEDDFDSVFGKAFARAYERALSDASARDRTT
jgi:type VI secretion system FHA domain protein